MQHLAAGKRDLLISDPNAAVASLALACELLGTHYGETAYECGEAYYYYGRALLDLARLEAGVIENLDGDGGMLCMLVKIYFWCTGRVPYDIDNKVIVMQFNF